MATFLLMLYALLITGILFCVIAGSSKEQDSLIRKLSELDKEAQAYHDLYLNAIHQLGTKENSPLSTPISGLPKEAPHAKG